MEADEEPSLEEIQAQLKNKGVEVSVGIVWKALRDLGYKYRTTRVEIPLTEEDREKRVAWC